MNLYRFDAELEPSGVIGHHEAATPQLFLVVRGAGLVRGGERRRVPIAAGQAAFWERGEWHETTTDTGLVAVVIESDEIDPDRYLHRLAGSGARRRRGESGWAGRSIR